MADKAKKIKQDENLVENKVVFNRSVKTRILIMIAISLLMFTGVFTHFVLNELKQQQRQNAFHEGQLVADSIHSGIHEFIREKDVISIQKFIDNLSNIRKENDFEINVIFLSEDQQSSSIIASNNVDNIEEADHDEHLITLQTIQNQAPIFSIEIEDEGDEVKDKSQFLDVNHPDNYFSPGFQVIDIFAPIDKLLGVKGSINIKLSLKELDLSIQALYEKIIITLIVCLLVLMVLITLYLNNQLFKPLVTLGKSLHLYGLSKVSTPSILAKNNDEVGYLAKQFNIMINRLNKSEKMNIQYQDHLLEMVNQRTSELVVAQDITLLSMGALAKTRDPETGGHIKRTQSYVKALALAIKDNPRFSNELTSENIELMYKSAPLHDIGKVGIPDSILLKPGKLTSEEFEIMKQHTTLGGDALALADGGVNADSFLNFAKEIAYYHQEKWDGSGYPEGLKEDNIPVSARLMAVADVYDALISRRCYKPPFPHKDAVSIISKGKASHFDPDMVDAFIAIQEEFRQIALTYCESDEEKDMLEQH